MHVIVIRRRWQKARLYTLLATIHATSAIRRALLRLLGFGTGDAFRPKPRPAA